MFETVAVEDLQVGMYIHLDLGWMSHPFPVSSFVLESHSDIERVRGLGLRQLRWSRDKSSLPDSADQTADQALPVNAQSVATSSGTSSVDDTAKATAIALPTPQERIAAQRAAMRVCEQQHREVSQQLRAIVLGAVQQPETAGAQAQALAQAMVDKMLGEHELTVLVLDSHVGNKTSAHALNVSVISLLLARALALGPIEMADVAVGALMHDIGKLSLPTHVHHVNEHMALADRNAYRDHVRLGVMLGSRMGLSVGAMQVIAQHHESADGHGFPASLKLERMSTAGRIVALVNRYEELCNPHIAAMALTPHLALAQLFTQGQGQTDVAMLTAFIRMMGVYPAGSVVQLTDERYALVTHVNSTRPLKPRVLVFEPDLPREKALLVNLNEQAKLGIRRSLPLAQVPKRAREYLQPAPCVTYFYEPLPPPVQAAATWV